MSASLEASMAAVAQLVGECRLGILSARSAVGCHLIEEVADLRDYREVGDSQDLDGLMTLIESGSIRRDARWSEGADEALILLVQVARGVV